MDQKKIDLAPAPPGTDVLLDAERIRQSASEDIFRLLQGRVADSVESSARLESGLEAELRLAARVRQLISELAAVNRTPMPQAGRYLEELRTLAGKLESAPGEPGRPDDPFRDSRARALERQRFLVSNLERALSGYAASQTVGGLRQALMAVFIDRCRGAGLYAQAGRGGQGDGAMELYTASLEVDPGLAAASCGRGALLAEAKRHRLAAEDFSRAVEIEPGLAAAWRGLGTARRFLNDYHGGLAAFEQAIRLEPGCSAAYSGRGIVLSLMGNLEGALRDFNRAIELDPLNTQAFNNRANELWDKGEHDRALEDYNQTLKINPRYVQALNNRGNLYRDLKEYDRALSDFARALEIDPDHTFVFVNRGNVRADLKQYQLAVEDYSRAIELDPASANAHNNRGIVYTEMGRRDLALEDFDRAIALDGRHSNSFTNRAIIHAENGRVDLAVADYNRAIALSPEKSANHLNLAELFLVSGRHQELLDCLQRADPLLREEDDRLVLCYLRSIAQRLLGLDFRESDFCFERILGRVSYVGWSFDAIDSWLEGASMDEASRHDIDRLTRQLKAKTKI